MVHLKMVKNFFCLKKKSCRLEKKDEGKVCILTSGNLRFKLGALPIASVTLCKFSVKALKVPFPSLCKVNDSIAFKN